MPTLTTLQAPSNTVVRPYTSGPLAPAGGALVMVVVSNTGSASDNASRAATDITSTIPIVGSWGLAQQSNPGTTASTSVYVWYAITTASPGTNRTITLSTGSSPADSNITILQATGIAASSVVGTPVGAFNTVASATLTLGAAPTTDDMVLAFSTSRNDSNGAVAAGGFTLHINQFKTNPTASQAVGYRHATTSTAVAFDGLNTVHNSLLAFVVKGVAAPAGPTPIGDWFVWNGTALVGTEADAFVWNGTALTGTEADVTELAPAP